MAPATLTGKKIRDAMREIPRITQRELEVWRLLAKGHTVISAGRILGKSSKTVENQREKLKVKLRAAGYVPPLTALKSDTNTMAWLIATAYRFGLVSVDVDRHMQQEMSDEVRLHNVNDIIFHRCRRAQVMKLMPAPALAFHP